MNKEKYNIQQGINEKRGEYERERRKKFLYLKHIGQYLVVPKRSEISEDIKTVPPKVVEQKEIMYSFLKSIIKAVKYPLIIAVGVFISGFVGEYPMYADMTVGGVFIVLYDILKHKVGIRIP